MTFFAQKHDNCPTCRCTEPISAFPVSVPNLGPPRHPWECPSCHLIHAPHVDRCTCKQPGLNVRCIAEGEA